VNANVPPALAPLTSPNLGDVASLPVSALLNPVGLLVQAATVFAIGLGASLFFYLPFSLEEGGLGWYVPAVAAIMSAALTLPLWFYREAEAAPPHPESQPDTGAH
jgi:hypothetical protein